MAIFWSIGRSLVHKLQPRDSRHFPQARSAAFKSQPSPPATLRTNHNYVLLQYRGSAEFYPMCQRLQVCVANLHNQDITPLLQPIRIGNCPDLLSALVQPLLQNHGCCFAIDQTLILRGRHPLISDQFLCANRSQALVGVF